MVDVPHHGHDRRPRFQVALSILFFNRVFVVTVLLLANRGAPELIEEHFDLGEVEALIDGHHEPEVLECGPDDLSGGHVDEVGQLRYGQEFVYTNDFPLSFLLLARLLLGGLALLFGRCGSLTTALLPSALELRHHPLDVLLDGALIDTLALFALPLPLAPLAIRGVPLRLDADLSSRSGGRRRLGSANHPGWSLGRSLPCRLRAFRRRGFRSGFRRFGNGWLRLSASASASASSST